MSNRIEIRGVIVEAEFDNHYWQDEIKNGLITPESRVRLSLADADKTKPLDLYINSVGGSVFAGFEMLNALSDWRRETGQPVNVSVGSICASAASTIAVMLGPVKCHENTEFMFHGAQAMAYGGNQHMGDMALLLDQINSKVAVALVSKYSASMDAVAEWFSEGRMGWLDAAEASSIGLVSEVIPAAGDIISFGDFDFNAIRDGQKVAAMIEAHQETNEGEAIMDLLKKLAQMMGLSTDEPTEDDIEQKLKEIKNSIDAAYEEGLEAGKAEGAKQSAEAVANELEEAKQAAVLLSAEVEQLQAKLTEAESAQAEAEQKAKALAGGFGAGDGADDDQGVAGSFLDLVNEKVAEGATMEAALLAVQRAHPQLHQQFLNKHK